MDVDTIKPGVNFVEAVEQAVGVCDGLVAVIGREWLGASDDSGRRRLENPEDLVRLEIATALERGENLDLSEPFQEALADHSGQLILDEDEVFKLRDSWAKLPGALSEECKRNLTFSLKKLIRNSAGAQTLNLLRLHENLLTNSALWGDDSEDQAVIEHILLQISDDPDLMTFEWVSHVLESHQELANKIAIDNDGAPTSTRELVSAWKTREDLDEGTWAALGRIAQALGIQKLSDEA